MQMWSAAFFGSRPAFLYTKSEHSVNALDSPLGSGASHHAMEIVEVYYLHDNTIEVQ